MFFKILAEVVFIFGANRLPYKTLKGNPEVSVVCEVYSEHYHHSHFIYLPLSMFHVTTAYALVEESETELNRLRVSSLLPAFPRCYLRI